MSDVIFSSIVFSCSVLCNSAFFFFFYSRAAVSVVFPPSCPVQVLSCALCLHHVFLSEQIKMMMMILIQNAGLESENPPTYMTSCTLHNVDYTRTVCYKLASLTKHKLIFI